MSFTSFPIWIPFISFSSLIAVPKTPKTMLSSSGEGGYPCLVPDFRGNIFNFSPLKIMFAVGLSCQSESHSVVSNSLWVHGPYSPWNSPGQNTGVGSPSLLQGIFPTQGLNQDFLHCRRILYHLSYQGSPYMSCIMLRYVPRIRNMIYRGLVTQMNGRAKNTIRE